LFYFSFISHVRAASAQRLLIGVTYWSGVTTTGPMVKI